MASMDTTFANQDEWVIGKGGRPIKRGGKAHKKWLKEQAEAQIPTTAVKGTGRVPKTATPGVRVTGKRKPSPLDASNDQANHMLTMEEKYNTAMEHEDAKPPLTPIQEVVQKLLEQREDELCRAYESLGQGPQFTAYLNKMLAGETYDQLNGEQ